MMQQLQQQQRVHAPHIDLDTTHHSLSNPLMVEELQEPRRLVATKKSGTDSFLPLPGV